jgi:hypothetical protein
MSGNEAITVSVNVEINVSDETAESCCKLLTWYVEDNDNLMVIQKTIDGKPVVTLEEKSCRVSQN